MSGGNLTMAEQGPDMPAPQQVPIPDDLREFIEVIDIMAGWQESGTYRLDGPEAALVWDDITWSSTGVFQTGMIAFPYEGLAEFELRYVPHSIIKYQDYSVTHPEWEFDLSREAVAEIASGAVKTLDLYACANPLCGHMSSRVERCSRCYLEPGADLWGTHARRVLGVCPYCHELLRSLYAEQCRHCGMDWHDREYPTKLGAEPPGDAS